MPHPCVSCGRPIVYGARCPECTGRVYVGALVPGQPRGPWTRVRKAVLEGEPFCRDCRRRSTVDPAYVPRVAVVVHHERRRVDGGRDQLSNLIPLCAEWHHARHYGSSPSPRGRGAAIGRIPYARKETALATGTHMNQATGRDGATNDAS